MTPYFANGTNVSGDAGITGNNQDPVNWGPPALTFSSGIAGLGTGQYAENTQPAPTAPRPSCSGSAAATA